MGYLTKENLDQIKQYIGETGIRDSDFPSTTSLNGSEYMTLVSASGNKKIKTDVLKTIFIGDGTSTTGGIQTINTKEDLDNLINKGFGNLVYVKDEDQYYSYSNTGTWYTVSKIYYGNEEPNDKTVIWINPSSQVPSNVINNNQINITYRYDTDLQTWVILNSNTALGIKTTNKKLLTGQEQYVSIDMVLERFADLLSTLKDAINAVSQEVDNTKTTLANIWTKGW